MTDREATAVRGRDRHGFPSRPAVAAGEDDDTAWLPAWRIRELVVTRELRPVEVVEAALERIALLDPVLHGFTTVAAEQALTAARDLEHTRSEPGPLFGVPVSVKDQWWTAGIRTTGGSRAYAAHVPAEDAVAVARLRAAGAVVVGKTSTPEFGLDWHNGSAITPETRNPWDRERTPGGSSGGAAATVAAGITPVALGSDCAGSIRLPSAFTGLLGLLPTLGRVPRHGGFGASLHFTGLGPIGRDARDLELLLGVLAGADPRDPLSSTVPAPMHRRRVEGVAGMRCAFWDPASPTGRPDPRVVAAVRTAADRMADLGAVVDEPCLRLGSAELTAAFTLLGDAERWALTGAALHADPGRWALLSERVAMRLDGGRRATAADYVAAMGLRYSAIGRFAELFATQDLLLSPTVGFIAPLIPDPDAPRPAGIIDYTHLANLCGLPAASVPCPPVSGMPVGLQIIGPAGREDLVLRAIEALTDG